MLNAKQEEICLRIWKRYNAGNHVSEPGGISFDEWHRKTTEIAPQIEHIINEYLSGRIDLDDFRKRIDSGNKGRGRTSKLWGFAGLKGQMFFNMVVSAKDKFQRNLDELLKEVIPEPENRADAVSKMQTFLNAVEQVAQTYDDRRKAPNRASVSYFLTYFWHIQNQDKWRIEYPRVEHAFEMLGLWRKTSDIANDYQSFIEISNEIYELFKTHSDSEIDFEEVGRAFYAYYSTQTEAISEGRPSSFLTAEPEADIPSIQQKPETVLPISYIPPVVSIFPQLARNDPAIEAVCQAEGQALSTVFESRLGVLFELLGFDVERLGQGHGRVPDIIAKSHDYQYGLIIDAKARSDAYSIGTEDSRKFIEYIKNESVKLKKKGGMSKIYLVIVSSDFSDPRDPAIDDIKSETDIHSVIMFRAEDLLRILDHRLRHPSDFDLGPSGFASLLLKDGVVGKNRIQTMLEP